MGDDCRRIKEMMIHLEDRRFVAVSFLVFIWLKRNSE